MARKRNVKLVKNTKTPLQRMKVVALERDAEIRKVLKKNVDLHNLATQGWSSRSKPSFPPFLNKQTGGIRFGVMVKAKNAESASISVYRMLNDKRHGSKATRVRKVILNAGYQNKTIPRRFGQFGKGGYIIRSKSGRPVLATNAYPGIEARLWDETINFVLEPEFTKAIKNAYRKGFSKL